LIVLSQPIRNEKLQASRSFRGEFRDHNYDRRGISLQVFVRDNNVDQALRILKKKMQREGVFREMKRRRFYEKPLEQTTREKAEAIRRARKLARKKAQREGLIAAPRAKRATPEKPGARRPFPPDSRAPA
jgi:small subunit ribosomal protein S21